MAMELMSIESSCVMKLLISVNNPFLIKWKQRFTRGYKRYKETSDLTEWKIGHIFHSIFT